MCVRTSGFDLVGTPLTSEISEYCDIVSSISFMCGNFHVEFNINYSMNMLSLVLRWACEFSHVGLAVTLQSLFVTGENEHVYRKQSNVLIPFTSVFVSCAAQRFIARLKIS